MAGFFGFFDYNKPGKGVEKEDFKPNISSFFRILLGRFWKLLQLNIIYFICSLPLIAIMFMFIPTNSQNPDEQMVQMFKVCVGSLLFLSVVGLAPIITGFTYVLRNYSKDQHAWVFSDFFEHIKKNFKQSLIILLIDLVAVMVLPFLYSFYTQTISVNTALLQSGTGNNMTAFYRNISFIAKTFIILSSVVYFVMHFYIYQIMVTFDMKIKQILKNSFIFALAHMPRNIGILILIALVSLLTFGFTTEIGILLSFLISTTLIGFIVNFIVQPVISKYMIKPQEQEEE